VVKAASVQLDNEAKALTPPAKKAAKKPAKAPAKNAVKAPAKKAKAGAKI
jgi:hypothetical protein